MTDTPAPANDGIEIANAVVLAIAGVMISWATYQGGLWDGQQADAYSRSNLLRVESHKAASHADTLMAAEIQLYSSWLDAKAAGDTRLADFYARRFPPDLRNAFNDWIREDPMNNPAAPLTPFNVPSYRPAGSAKSAELEKQSVRVFDDGQRANSVSDGFNQGGTVLSTALFFAGISQVFHQRRMRVILMLIAALFCVLGTLRVFTLPMTFLLNSPAVGS